MKPARNGRFLLAAERVDFEGIKRELTSGADVNSRDRGGRTALHFAVRKRRTELVKFLLDFGCEPNPIDDREHTPLHEAALQGDSETIRLLLQKGADPNRKTLLHLTPLDMARQSWPESIELIALLETPTQRKTGPIDWLSRFFKRLSFN